MPEQPPELAPTFLSLKIAYAALLGAVFGVSALLALLLADSGLANLYRARYLLGAGLLLFALFVLAIGTLLLIPALGQLRQALQLERSGKIVAGRVLEKRLEKDKRGRRFCYVVYAIDAQFRFKQAIPQATYLRLKEGDPLKVRYLPGDASITRLELD